MSTFISPKRREAAPLFGAGPHSSASAAISVVMIRFFFRMTGEVLQRY